MKAYLDSGVFIDYFIGRGQAGAVLRTTPRRGRTPHQLLTDAETCFASLGNKHIAVTSALTCYEVEEALYRALARSSTGLTGRKQLLIASSRPAISQVLVTLELFRIELADLTKDVIVTIAGGSNFVTHGIRAADAIHVATAIATGVDLFVTTDARLLKLDGVFVNGRGSFIRCLDTDAAIPFL